MNVRKEVRPFIVASIVFGGVVSLLSALFHASDPVIYSSGIVVALVLSFYMLFFFRDPERDAPADDSLILASADGVVARIKEIPEDKHLKTDTIRISIFLSLFDVHVNRAPISGKAKFLGYSPGKRYFTFQEKSSEFNQHNAILFDGKTKCLVYQIVGPVCRRVVYWPSHENEELLKAGDRIGMMKFGSRLDMYLPKNDVVLEVKEGDKVSAGISVVAKLKSES